MNTPRLSHLFAQLQRPASWVISRWRHEWRWYVQRFLFEQRHYRRLIPLFAFLCFFTITLSAAVLALGLLLGGSSLIWDRAFAQNVLASMLTLPISLAIAVFVGTLLQKHSLRFQARHAGDKLADHAQLEVFKFILFLRNECGISIDISGPTDHRFVWRARESVAGAFAASSWSLRLPAEFPARLDATADALTSCFQESPDLRFAFPRSFDVIDRLQPLMKDIKSGRSSSDPMNTTLIVLKFAAEAIQDLE